MRTCVGFFFSCPLTENRVEPADHQLGWYRRCDSFFPCDARSDRCHQTPDVRPGAAQDSRHSAPEEVARFLEAAPGVKYKAAFSVAYGAGLRVSEVAALKVSDIDSERMMLRVEQGKAAADRYAMLSPCCWSFYATAAHRTPQGVAVHGPGSVAANIDTPTQPRLPCGGTHGRDHQTRVAAHAST